MTAPVPPGDDGLRSRPTLFTVTVAGFVDGLRSRPGCTGAPVTAPSRAPRVRQRTRVRIASVQSAGEVAGGEATIGWPW